MSTLRAAPARRQRFRSIKADKLGLTTPEKVDEFAKDAFPEYDEVGLEGLKQVYRYTPEQMEAVKAGEAAVNPRDLVLQGRVRDDKYRVPYLEDFSKVQPVIDLKAERKLDAKNYQWLSEQDFMDKLFEKMMDKSTENMQEAAAKAFKRSMERVKSAQGTEIDLTTQELEDMETWPELQKKYVLNEEEPGAEKAAKKAEASAAAVDHGTMSAEEAKKLLEELVEDFSRSLDVKKGNTASSEIFDEDDRLNITTSGNAPPLGKVPGVEGLYKHAADPEDEGLDDEGTYQYLKQVTGMSVRDILSLFTKTLVTRFVTNQTRLGKVRSSSVMVIAGNGNGRLGVGVAKSADFGTAAMAARMLAIRNMKPIRRYENRTIYGNVKQKVSGTVVELRARPPGFGLRVPFRLFEMCRAAGIHDISAVIPRSRSPMNTVKATFLALTNQPDPEEIAKGRGKKLVDVRKVYYGGSVY
ncbi:unnamed protein product [Parascedosporium putredinis]|uniref:Small ribosomal subunit protein uS5m n=1 Tax=Parascedosporium putredinis TaxID=1442378 RepID=A0A9P1GYA9_9PEZI|nr:unnamed protein product [Parascedosporium putredinis]CAI7990522.1 unnamed protein product [Parascedosporium putredinis]